MANQFKKIDDFMISVDYDAIGKPKNMKTWSNGKIFLITGHLCGKFTPVPG